MKMRVGKTTDIHLSSGHKLLSYDKEMLSSIESLRNFNESVVNDEKFSVCIDETSTILMSDALSELQSEIDNADYCSSDDIVPTWISCNYTEVLDTYNEVCSNEAGGKTLVFTEYLSGSEDAFNINYYSRPFCASKSCTAVMVMEYTEKLYEALEEIESYSIYFQKDYSLTCANELEDVTSQYQELEDVYDGISCGDDEEYYDYSGDRECEATEETIEEHKRICESEHIGGKQFLANIVFSSNTSDISYVNYPFCIVDLECHDTTVLSSQLTEMFYSNVYGESHDWAITVSVSTYEDTNDDHDVHDDSFHIKSNFPSAHHQWCIQPKDDHSEGTLDPRTDIIIRQCNEESAMQEWTFDNYGRISPVLAPYLCITKAAFNRLELNYCGSIEDTDSMFIHNAFEDTIVRKSASHMAFTIADYDVGENEHVLLAERDRSLNGQEWKILSTIEMK